MVFSGFDLRQIAAAHSCFSRKIVLRQAPLLAKASKIGSKEVPQVVHADSKTDLLRRRTSIYHTIVGAAAPVGEKKYGQSNWRWWRALKFQSWRHLGPLGGGAAVSLSPKNRWMDYLTNTGPTYVARDGVVCMVDYLRPEDDPDRYTPSATCVPFRSSLADAQTSAEDVAFMMDGYCRALLLLGRVIEMGLANGLHQEITDLLQADEKHMLRNSTDPNS